VLDHTATLVDLDCAKADRRARAFTLTLLRVELGVDNDNALADDLSIAAHFVLPSLRTVQIS
jgi:hypothetical protein